MNLKTWAPLTVAIVLGGVAAKVGRDVLARRATGLSKTVVVNVSRVVVAKDNIAAGMPLKAADVATSNVPEGSVTPGSFNDPTRVVNRVATTPVLKGQPILENMLAPEGSGKGLTAIVPDGMRAVTLEINEVSGVGGLLVPGCRVDVVSTLSGENGQSVARTVAHNLQVVAIGRRLSDGSKNKDKEDDAAEAGPPARNVTLLVTPREAELIDLAAHNSSPRLVLRGSRDSNKDMGMSSDGVTIGELRGARPESTGGGGYRQMLTQFFDPIGQAIAQAQEQQAASAARNGLFNHPVEPATQPAAPESQHRQVTVIRNTREQAVQVEVQRESRRAVGGPDFANTDTSDAIKSPGSGN